MTTLKTSRCHLTFVATALLYSLFVSSNPAGANAADGQLHLMVFFAHPVDRELKTGAVVAMWANLRQKVMLVSTTNPAPPNSIKYSECDSNRTFITHLISDSAGSKIWDVGHMGAWDAGGNGRPFFSFSPALDQPVGMGDGSLMVHNRCQVRKWTDGTHGGSKTYNY